MGLQKEDGNVKRNDSVSAEETQHLYIDGYGIRHVLATLGFLGLTCVYAMRVNLSVAIVAMVNSSMAHNVSLTNTCPIVEDYSDEEETEFEHTGDFNWDEKTQGLVHGSFYYGYAITNILGGLASDRFGGYMVNGLGVLITGILTIISPFAAYKSSGWFIAVRILEGCAEGVTFPALNNLVAKWYPVNERSKFITIIFAGMQFGTVITLPIGGWLSASSFLGGWPSVFYVFGVLGVVWSILWFWLLTDDPSQHPRISASELKYIKKGCPTNKDKYQTPWGSIFRCKYFWIVAAMHFGNNWGFYTLLTELPTYLDKILHIHIQNNGVFSAMPYFGAWLFSIVFSLLIDRLIARESLTLLSVRRISMIFAGYGPMICLIGMCFVNCNQTVALAILILSGSFNGAMYCGLLSTYTDLSPRFAGILMGLGNSIATIPGFLAPYIAGVLTQGNQTLMAWKIVFLISAGVYLVTVSAYVFCITTETQPWNEPKHKDTNEKETSNEDKELGNKGDSIEYSIKL